MSDPRGPAVAVHALLNQEALCRFSSYPPPQWPEGHRWVGAKSNLVAHVTCDGCRAVLAQMQAEAIRLGRGRA